MQLDLISPPHLTLAHFSLAHLTKSCLISFMALSHLATPHLVYLPLVCKESISSYPTWNYSVQQDEVEGATVMSGEMWRCNVTRRNEIRSEKVLYTIHSNYTYFLVDLLDSHHFLLSIQILPHLIHGIVPPCHTSSRLPAPRLQREPHRILPGNIQCNKTRWKERQ